MAQQQKSKGGNNRRQNNTYSSANFSSYDEQISSLSFSYANEGSFIEVAPIIPAMIGKTPKQGEKVYDYDNRVSTFISPQHAILLRRALNNLLEIIDSGESVPAKTEVVVPTGQGIRRITIIAPGRASLKIKGKKTNFPDNFMLKLETKKSDDETILAYHILQNNVVNYINGEETNEELVETDMIMLTEFCEMAIELSLGKVRHTASMTRNLVNANQSSSNNSKKGSAFNNMDDDEDDTDEDYNEEGDNEEEDEDNSSKKPKKSSSKSTKQSPAKKSRKNISSEMEDDEDGEDGDYDDDIPM
jgi:hypothetical protein